MTETDIKLAITAKDIALEMGASAVRVKLNMSTEDLVGVLNGEIDKVTRCVDRSLTIALFVDGRFGAFSTNKLGDEELRSFIGKALSIARSLQPDPYRRLPDPERCCKNATNGNELHTLDSSYFDTTAEKRAETARKASIYGSDPSIISEEGEYTDSIYETLLIDSQGTFCRDVETSSDYGVEITIKDGDDKYSAYWWDSYVSAGKLDARACGLKALEKARAQIGSAPIEGRRTNMVVSSEVAGKLISPILSSLSAYSIQQNNSFLMDSLGKKVFHEGMTLVDSPWIDGNPNSKLFDTEGVATKPQPIIEKGSVSMYFVNTYMSGKTGLMPTTYEATRPQLLPYPKAGMGQKEILELCGSGILVTEFNGGNSNSTTGDFSYGIEGFVFENGKIVAPVSEMLVTGNFITLWNNLIAAGDDARECMSKLIPTLAFCNVDINGK